MEKAITKAALINGILTTANCAIDANGFVTIKYLPKFNSAWLKLIAPGSPNVYRRDTLPNAEITKVTNVAPVTVVALQKYKLQETTINDFIESWSRQPLNFGYTAPAVLGANATENHNMFVSLAYKINNTGGAHATAYPVITVTVAGTNFIVGEVITGATSGATGILLDINAAGTSLNIGVIGGTFEVGENIDDESGTGPDAILTITLGVGLRIVDDAGYYVKARGGANTFLPVAGFAAADVTVQSQLANVTLGTTAGLVVGTAYQGATSLSVGTVVRVVSGTVAIFAMSGTSVFTVAELVNGSAVAAVAATASGSTVSTILNAPSFAYAQGQGADLLADVPRGSRDSSNLNSGSFEGPQGDTPLVGTEYVSSDWAINWPVSVDNIGQSTTTIPAPMRLWTDLASYNGGTVNTRLDAVGLTD